MSMIPDGWASKCTVTCVCGYYINIKLAFSTWGLKYTFLLWSVKNHGCHNHQIFVRSSQLWMHVFVSLGYTWVQLDLQGATNTKNVHVKTNGQNYTWSGVQAGGSIDCCRWVCPTFYFLITPDVFDQSKTYTPSFVPNRWRGTDWWFKKYLLVAGPLVFTQWGL